LDKIDQAIIKYLRNNGRAPYLEIASKMGMSEAAVRRRVKNLVRHGIIRKFTVDLQASYIASALTLVAVTPGSPTSEVANKIKLLDSVSKVNEITGQYDIGSHDRGIYDGRSKQHNRPDKEDRRSGKYEYNGDPKRSSLILTFKVISNDKEGKAQNIRSCSGCRLQILCQKAGSNSRPGRICKEHA